MAIRNFLLNDHVREYLTERFDLDIVTTIDIQSPSEWGIRKIIDPGDSGPLTRRAQWLNIRLLQRLQDMDFASMCLAGPLPEMMALRLHRDAMNGHPGQMLRWAAIHGSRLESPFRRVVGGLNRVATRSIFNLDDYRIVLLAHTFTTDVVGYGIEANRRGIPVISIALGHDNLLNSLSFSPDLLMVWGRSDQQTFETSHRNRDGGFQNTKCVAIGSLSDDLYRSASAARDHDPDGSIVFPAMDPIAEPDQMEVCEHLIAILDRVDAPNPVVVRTRPGLMQDEWKSFADRHTGRVTLQTPKSVAYDKRFALSGFDKESAARAVEEYAGTLRSAALVVTPGLTTVGIEAMSFGIPTFAVALDRSDEVMGSNPSLMLYQAHTARNREWLEYQLATTPSKMESMIRQVLIDHDRGPYVGHEFVKFQMTAADGQAGERWVSAVEEFVSSQGING
jgi:hypothetical protein